MLLLNKTVNILKLGKKKKKKRKKQALNVFDPLSVIQYNISEEQSWPLWFFQKIIFCIKGKWNQWARGSRNKHSWKKSHFPKRKKETWIPNPNTQTANWRCWPSPHNRAGKTCLPISAPSLPGCWRAAAEQNHHRCNYFAWLAGPRSF